ncbi:MAG: heparan-alpha-glucosaminide N-acetyltransferase domain-containing protein [Candidatus Hydrothermales bacterium]
MEASKKRYLFIDILRGIAVLEMIHGHTLDALLSPSQKLSPFYTFWTHIRGYTAPLFLFSSGISFYLSTIGKEDYLFLTRPFFKRLGRIFFIILLGYTLHLPYFSLRKTLFNSTFDDVNRLLNIDILQCIGFSLLILQLLYFILRREVLFLFGNYALILLLTILAFYLIKGYDPKLPLFFSKFLKDSNFPLVPFSIYLFSGIYLGYLIKKVGEKNSSFFIFATLSFLNYVLMRSFLMDLSDIYLKILILGILSFLLFQFEEKKSFILRIVEVIGRESLFVYYAHLLLIYGSVFNKISLKFFFSGKLGFFEIYIIVLSLFLIFTFLSHIWNFIKKRYFLLSVLIKNFFYLYFIINFITRPY